MFISFEELSENTTLGINKTIINIHPSLLPKFKGLHTFERILKNKEKKTGCTVHYVTKNLEKEVLASNLIEEVQKHR